MAQVTLSTLSEKLSGILGDKRLPDGYENVLETALANKDITSLADDADIADGLSDIEIGDILTQLHAHANASTDPAEKETIYAVIEALSSHIYNDRDVDKEDGETSAVEWGSRIHNEDIANAPADTNGNTLSEWVNGINGENSFDTIFPTLPIEDQIKVLEYYKNKTPADTGNIDIALGLLDPVQQANLLAELPELPENSTIFANIYTKTIKDNADTVINTLFGTEEGILTDEQRDNFYSNLQAAKTADSNFDTTKVDDYFTDKEFETLLTSLPITPDNADEATPPTDSIKAFFDNNQNSKDTIFEKIANGDLILDDSQLAYFWDYLGDNPTDQEAFLSAIKPYSPVHLSILQTLEDYASEDEEDTELSRDEQKYRDSLQALSDAIGKGNVSSLSNTDIDNLFPGKDENFNNSDVVGDIFGNVSDVIDDGGYSEKLGEFLSAGKFEATAITDFIGKLSSDEIADFSGALFSDSSPIFALLNKEGGDEAVDSLFENLFTALSGENITHEQRVNFLKGIDPGSEFYEYLENAGHDTITELIDTSDDEDFNTADYDEQDIQDFFANDISKTTKVWAGNEESGEILEELSNAEDDSEIKKILKQAEKDGNLESVLYAITSDNFEDGSPEFYNALFKTLRSDSEYADIFFGAVDINSNLGRTFAQLSDNKTSPFDKISYDVNPDTGAIDFGSDQKRLLTALSDKKLEGATVFFDTLETIQEEYEDAVGGDNADVKKLLTTAQKGKLDDTFFDNLFAPTSDGTTNDYTNPEEILDILADDNNILFKSLSPTQLSDFITQFSSWISKQTGTDVEDGLLDYFGSSLDEDSLFYKALVKGGADEDAFLDGDYKGFFSDAGDTDDAAKFIKQFLEFNNDDDSLAFVSEQLKGTKKSTDIKEAVTNIIDYATANGQAIDDLIVDIASGGGIVETLTSDQSKALIEAVFEYIATQKPQEDEDISETALLFIDNIAPDSVAYDIIQKEYPAIADYLGITPETNSDDDEPEEYDDADIADELEDLLEDKQLLNAYISKSDGSNEKLIEDDVSDDDSKTSDGEYTLVEDDVDDADSDSQSVDNFESGEFDKATDAALAVLGKTLDIAGEPDFETGVLSTFFFENNSVEDLADAATEGKFDTKEVIGTLQLIPLDKQADFIREYIGNDNIDAETQDYLLGRLLIMAVNGEVGDRTIEAILKDVGIDNLTSDVVKDIMDKWAEAVDKYTDASATSIDDTYEQVLAASEKLDGGTENQSDAPVSPYGNNQGYGTSPIYGAGFSPYGGSPYGVGGFSPYGAGALGGLNPYGTGGFSPYGVNPYGAGLASPYTAGFTAATGGATPYGATTPPSNIIINATDASKGDVNVSVSPDGSVAVNRSGTENASANTTQATDTNKDAIKARRQSEE